MSGHAYHPQLPGYAEGQLLIDGCAECERRAEDPIGAFMHLDEDRQLIAWRLMRAEKWSGGTGAQRSVSMCERKMLGALYGMGVWLQRAGIEPDEVERRFELRMLSVKVNLGMLDEAGHDRLASMLGVDKIDGRLREVGKIDLSGWTPGQRDALRLALENAVDAINDHGILNLLFHARDGQDLPDGSAVRGMECGLGYRELADAVDADLSTLAARNPLGSDHPTSRQQLVDKIAAALADQDDYQFDELPDTHPTSADRAGYRASALRALGAIQGAARP